MHFSGVSPDRRLVEIAEIGDHPFMLGSQFHPEFTSRPNRPHPLFKRFIEMAVEGRRSSTNAVQSDGRGSKVAEPKAIKV